MLQTEARQLVTPASWQGCGCVHIDIWCLIIETGCIKVGSMYFSFKDRVLLEENGMVFLCPRQIFLPQLILVSAAAVSISPPERQGMNF